MQLFDFLKVKRLNELHLGQLPYILKIYLAAKLQLCFSEMEVMLMGNKQMRQDQAHVQAWSHSKVNDHRSGQSVLGKISHVLWTRLSHQDLHLLICSVGSNGTPGDMHVIYRTKPEIITCLQVLI